MTSCWKAIGVWGDSSCQELVEAIHCRNCAVYARAGRGLLDRAAPGGYLQDCTDSLADPAAEEQPATDSVVVFRVGQEWFGLETQQCREILEARKVQGVPHVSGDTFLGLVNVRGALQLCASLAVLLGVRGAAAGQEAGAGRSRGRMLAAEVGGETWVFPCDDVDGVVRFRPEELGAPPVTVSKQPGPYTRGVLQRDGREIACLAPEALATGLAATLP